MDMEKLDSFMTLAKVKNFTSAAEQLYISQPALSKRIGSLENELNVLLFNRIGKKIFLTHEGEYLYNFAKNTIANYNLLKENIIQIKNIESGTLKFGATNFIGVYIMPKIIKAFTKKYPNIDIRMTISSSKNIISQLETNELEFIFVSDYIIGSESNLITQDLTTDELKVIVSKNNALSQKDRCTFQDIKNQKYISKGDKSSQDSFIKEILDKNGYDFSHKIIINNQEAIKEAVINNIGFSIISEKSISRELELGLLKAIELKGIKFIRKIQYSYIKYLQLTPAATEFLALAKNIYVK